LPKMGSTAAAELFFIVAMTDASGDEAITKRIREQWNASQYIQQAGLTLSTSYRALDATERTANESMQDLIEHVAATIQKLTTEETSSRISAYGEPPIPASR
jgi:hypothetical protein